jgi:hypothetical protein
VSPLLLSTISRVYHPDPKSAGTGHEKDPEFLMAPAQLKSVCNSQLHQGYGLKQLTSYLSARREGVGGAESQGEGDRAGGRRSPCNAESMSRYDVLANGRTEDRIGSTRNSSTDGGSEGEKEAEDTHGGVRTVVCCVRVGQEEDRSRSREAEDVPGKALRGS